MSARRRGALSIPTAALAVLVFVICLVFGVSSVARAEGETGAATEAAAGARAGESDESSLEADDSEATAFEVTTPEGIKVSASVPEGALPEGVKLVANLINDEAENSDVAAKLDEAQVSYDGFVALDVRFEDAEGVEVEPSETVDVRFEVPDGILPEDAEELTVHHFAEDETGAVAEVEAVADEAEKTEGTIEEAVDPSEGEPAAVVEFSVDSFSLFTLTYNSGNGITVHVVDEDGNDINGNGQVDFSDLSHVYSPTDFGEKWIADQWVSVEKLTDTWASKTEGYEFVGAYTSRAMTDEFTWIRYNTGTEWYNGWRYNNSTSGSGESLSEIYLVFREVASSAQTAVSIADNVAENGKLTASYSDGGNPFYVWQKLVNGEWQTIDQLRVNGDQYLYDDENQSSLNVVLEIVNDDVDEGGSWYRVSAYASKEAYENGTGSALGTSGAFRLDYYDQLQNGDFENTNLDELTDGRKNNYQYPVGTKDLVWDTTGNDQQIEIVNSTNGRDRSDYNNSDGAQNGAQYAELNCQAAGALYQDVLTVPGTDLNWQFYHRGRNGRDTMYLVIAPADRVRDVQTQTDLENLIDKIQRQDNGYTEADGYFLYSATDGNSSWGYHSSNNQGTGAYEVPNGQYLTRFFFVAGDTASGNDTVGNLLDNVRFTTELLPAQQGQANLTITKVVTGVAADDADALNDYTVAVNVDGKTVTLDSFNQRSDGSWYATGYTTVDGITANGNKTVTVTESAGNLAGYVSDGSTVSVNSGATAEGTSAEIILQDRGSGTVEFTNAYEKFAPEANKRIRDNGDGSYTLSLDVVGKSTKETTSSYVPLDIVLVLDESSSMSDDFSGGWYSDSRMEVLQENVNNFIDRTLEANNALSDGAQKHRIAIVSFNDTAAIDQRLIEVTNTNVASLKRVVNSLDPDGNTYPDEGFVAASSALNESREGAKKIVIFFTDGVPAGAGISDFEGGIAAEAVNEANRLKQNNTTIYAIASVSGANPSDTSSDFNAYMNAVSSKYPNATAEGENGHLEGFWHQEYVGGSFEVTWNGNPQGDYYKTANNADELEQVFDEIYEEITTGASISKVSIVDELSAYAKIDTTKVTYEENAVTGDESLAGFHRVTGGITMTITPAQGEGNSVTITAGSSYEASSNSYPASVDFYYKPAATGDQNTTGTIMAVFPDSYELQDGWTYDMRFDVVPTDAAYAAYEANVTAGGNGYGNSIGDPDTDLPDNTTSSGKPGFRSNRSAYVQYDVDGTTDEVYYDHPVIQAESLTITDVLEVTKTMNGHELDSEMFDFTVTPKSWDNGAAGEDRVEVTAQQAAEKAELSTDNGVYTYTNPTEAAEDTASIIRMGNQIRFTRCDVGKTYVYEYAEDDSNLHAGYTEISSDNVTFDQNRYRVELSVSYDAEGKIQVTMSKFAWDAGNDNWSQQPESVTIKANNCDCGGEEPLMTIGFENSYSKTYGLDIFKGEFVLNEDGTIKKDDQGNPVVNTNEPLSGAEFTLYSDSSCTVEVAKVKTGENGHAIFSDLAEGDYFLRETRVPSGYQLLDKTVTVKIEGGTATFTVPVEEGDPIVSDSTAPNDQGNFEFSVGNKPNPDLPSSGSAGTIVVTATGVAAIALSGAYLARKRMNSEI